MDFVVEQVKGFAKQHPTLTLTNFAMSLTFPVDDIFVPYLIGLIVTDVQSKNPKWINKLILLCVILIVVQFFYASTFWHDAILFPKLENHVRHAMTKDFLEKYENADAEVGLGRVIARFVKIPESTKVIFELLKNYLIPYGISFLFTSILIIKYDGIMGLVMIVCAMALFSIVIASPNVCNQVSSDMDNSVAKINEEIDDILRNSQTIYTSNQVQNELDRIAQMEKEYETTYFSTTSCIVKQRYIALIALCILLLAFVYRSYQGIIGKRLTPGQFVTIFTIITTWFTTLAWLSSNIRELVMNVGHLRAYKKLQQSICTPQEEAHTPNHSPTTSDIPSTGIYINNLSIRIKDKRVINDLTLHIKPMERVAIVGDIGSGKTTLLKTLVRLRKPYKGEIYIDGQDISVMDVQVLRKRVGYVMQNPVLLNRTIYENITYGLDQNKVNVDTIQKLIHQLGLADVLTDINAPVGKHGSNLSGGQRQIIQCVRILLSDAQVLLLDEITSSLDNITKSKLFDILQYMFVNRTVIMVTHDRDLLSMATRIFNMTRDA